LTSTFTVEASSRSLGTRTLVALDRDRLAAAVVELQAIVEVEDLELDPGRVRDDAVDDGAVVRVALVGEGGGRRGEQREQRCPGGDRAKTRHGRSSA
jgi:hypothetical protein